MENQQICSFLVSACILLIVFSVSVSDIKEMQLLRKRTKGVSAEDLAHTKEVVEQKKKEVQSTAAITQTEILQTNTDIMRLFMSM